MTSNIDKLREECELLEENRKHLIQYLKEAEQEAELWKNAYNGQREAIRKDVEGIERKTTFVTGNIMSQQKVEEAYRNGHKSAMEKIKQLLEAK